MNKFLCAFVFLFSFSAIPAFAQDNSIEREVEEVVVTALRKETSLQDTAITITAITGSDLEVKQIENFEDLQFAVPTLGFSKGAFSGSGITLRVLVTLLLVIQPVQRLVISGMVNLHLLQVYTKLSYMM